MITSDITLDKSANFYKKLSMLPRHELLELINLQDPYLREQVEYIEEVFRTRLTHLNWNDGTPIVERPFTNQELAYLVDEPFEVDEELTRMGFGINEQQKLHFSKDAVLWAKHYLNARPRVYQVLIIRDPNQFKVLRAGRRIGKSFSMAVILLHYAFTTKNGRALVVTPVKTQAALIYEEMLKLAGESKVVKESIIRNVTSPNHEIDLSNGSTVRFFSSGSKTGSKSDVTRGQEASIIILDELDYMGDEDLDALFAMLQKTNELQAPKRLIGASTPTGRRGTFYNWCTEKDSDFKEFYYPSYCNPLWEEKMERVFRRQYSDSGYRHEFEADWGEDAAGVYPQRYLDIAFQHPGWKYEKSPNRLNESIFILGVDWDKYGAGVNLVILEKLPPNYHVRTEANKLKLVYREEMPKDDYAFIKAVEYIIQLDQVYHFKHIYVDAGAGEMQWEALRKYGVEHPFTGFAEKTRRVSFAESVEVRDPFTFQKTKKQIKPFMVDNLRQMLEKEQIIMPGEDEQLYLQLISFVVARTTVTGIPVFETNAKDVQDHAHDALILACLAVAEHYSDLLHYEYATKSFAVSNEAFQPTFEYSADPATRAVEQEMVEEKWGGTSSAPIHIRREMSYNRRRGSKIRRRMF